MTLLQDMDRLCREVDEDPAQLPILADLMEEMNDPRTEWMRQVICQGKMPNVINGYTTTQRLAYRWCVRHGLNVPKDDHFNLPPEVMTEMDLHAADARYTERRNVPKEVYNRKADRWGETYCGPDNSCRVIYFSRRSMALLALCDALVRMGDRARL